MRNCRAAPLAAIAALLVTLAACSSDDLEPNGDGAPESVSSPANQPTGDDAPGLGAGSEVSSHEDAAPGGAAATRGENRAAHSDASRPEEHSSDHREPGGNDAQWISPGSASQGEGDLAGGPLMAVDLRSGVHDYYDRVVVDLEGEGGNPGWYADYTGDPVEDGSGLPIEIEGNAFLHVSVTGFRYPEPGEEFAYGLTRVDGTGVTEAYVSSPSEGQIQVVLGVDSTRPYRVFVLPDPLRLVIDIEIAR